MSNDVDDDASLAYALSLQDVFNQMSISPQNSPYDDSDYQFALQLQADLERSQSYPDPGKWKAPQSTYTAQGQTSTGMNDQEYARMLQAEGSTSAGPLPTNDKKWVASLTVSAEYGTNPGYGMMSPPISPLQSPTTFSFSPQSYHVPNTSSQWTAAPSTTFFPTQTAPGVWNGTINVNIPPMPEIPPPPKTVFTLTSWLM
jgi:hypothetical protein